MVNIDEVNVARKESIAENMTRRQIEALGGQYLVENDDAISVNCLGNLPIWLLKDDVSLTPSISHSYYWEAWITSWFTRNIKRGDIFYDIGANVGYYSIVGSILGAKVVSYECNPKIVKLLKRTNDSGGYKLSIRPIALADETKKTTLSFPGNYNGSASIMVDFEFSKYGEAHHIGVDATTLNKEVEIMGHPSIVKMDIEGAEELAWNGGRDIWYGNNPPLITFEYTPKAYSSEFDRELFENWNVTRIGFDGIEKSIGIEWVQNLTDWDMIVLRRKDLS